MTAPKTKTKAPKSDDAHKAEAKKPDEVTEATVVAAPATAPIPPGLNDIREDGAPVVGHFVEITKGDDKGLIGTLKEVQSGDTAVVVDRLAPGHVVAAPLADVVGFEGGVSRFGR